MLQPFIKIFTIAITILIISIIIDGHFDSIYQSDIGVVFGNKVTINGPSKRLKSRLDKAIELYNKGYINTIIVSGGIDINELDESQIMLNYLVENKIPEKYIIKDKQGDNSFNTVKNALNIAKQHDQILAISQFYHITRIKLTFKKLGYPNINYAHSNYYEYRDIYSIIREFFALLKYIIYY
jgi:vancomycin permeability regulator SanA